METPNKKEYTFSNDTGDAALTVYEIIPGVQLVYSSVHMDSFDLSNVTEGNVIEIHHCREGRIEQAFGDEYFYLMPGDFSIALKDQIVNSYKFPLKHYHGITIGIREDIADQWLSHFMEDINVKPLDVAKKLCKEEKCHIIRNESYIEHIFSELYSVPEHIKKGYFKLKIMELFLILSSICATESSAAPPALPKAHVHLANQIASYLSAHMDSHVTIPELSKLFGISETPLKTIFKAVYGIPVFSYMRVQKMQAAAQVLIYSDRPVADISYEFGYSNTGKFTTAFKKIMGETPSEYRRAHTKTHTGK